MATGRILILIETSQHSRLGGIIADIPFYGILFAILMLLLVELLEKMKQSVGKMKPLSTTVVCDVSIILGSTYRPIMIA